MRPLALFAALALGGLAAQTTPRIDGHWTVLADKSPGYVQRAGVPPLTLTVQQTKSEVTLTLGRGEATRYVMGEETTDTKNGRRVTALARWEGEQFVVTGQRQLANGETMEYRLLITLNGDGELVMERHSVMKNSNGTTRMVFARAPHE